MLAVAGKDEQLIGAARLGTGEHESATIGFALRPDQWGQGKGVATVRLLPDRTPGRTCDVPGPAASVGDLRRSGRTGALSPG